MMNHYSRRNFLGTGRLLLPSFLGAEAFAQGKSTRTVTVFATAGGPLDSIARSFCSAASQVDSGSMYVPENLAVPNIDTKFKYSSEGIYIFSGDTLRRIAREPKVGFEGVFRIIAVLGRSRATLGMTQDTGIISIGDFQRARGSVAIADPSKFGETLRNLVLAPLVAFHNPHLWVRTDYKTSFQREQGLNFGFTPSEPWQASSLFLSNRSNSEMDLGIGALDNVWPGLPFDQFYFLAVPRQAPTSFVNGLTQLARPCIEKIHAQMPAISYRQDRLNIAEIRDHLFAQTELPNFSLIDDSILSNSQTATALQANWNKANSGTQLICQPEKPIAGKSVSSSLLKIDLSKLCLLAQGNSGNSKPPGPTPSEVKPPPAGADEKSPMWKRAKDWVTNKLKDIDASVQQFGNDFTNGVNALKPYERQKQILKHVQNQDEEYLSVKKQQQQNPAESRK
jgi:hypothetical protein